MISESDRRLSLFSLYADPPDNCAEAVARARSRAGDPAEAAQALIQIERVCFAHAVGAMRRERAALELEGGGALLPPSVLRQVLQRVSLPLSARVAAFALRRVYAALPGAHCWNLADFEPVSLESGQARLELEEGNLLGALALAPPRVAERLAARREPIDLAGLLRWIARTGAPTLPCDQELKTGDERLGRTLRLRQEAMLHLLWSDLRLS